MWAEVVESVVLMIAYLVKLSTQQNTYLWPCVRLLGSGPAKSMFTRCHGEVAGYGISGALSWCLGCLRVPQLGQLRM